MREKLIEILETVAYPEVLCDGEVLVSTARVADHLIANGVTVQKWIPVTERLPEAGTGRVLVVKKYRGKQYVDIGEIIEGNAYCASDEYAIHPNEHKLTHWMPLPEPPKGE